jgi:formylglycine-generating enzyme required for sulfatase activity
LRIGGLLRALKPLRKLASSPIDLEPDEEATVDLWCERGVQAIVLRPRPEKVRSVCLVIDSSASMEIWSEVTRAWRRALVGSGLFRYLREFRLDSDGAQPTVRPWSARPGLPKITKRDSRDKTPKLPLGPEPLVLIFTDASSRAWWNGSAFGLATAWARQAALGLIGLLPERMWHRTAMSRCSFVPLVRPAGGGPLYTLCLPGLGASGDVIPVASVQEHSLATLALLLGENHREVKGGGLQIGEAEWTRPGAVPGPGSIGAEERLDQFLRSASPPAAQLARLLSLFNPPSLKAMRLVRAAAGLGATSVHEAEVVLGGLLRIEPGRATGSSSWVYRFHAGVQERLQRSSARDDPELQRFAGRFRDYLRRRRNEMAGIAGAIPLDSGDSAIRASEDCFLDIDEEALPMVLDDAEDLIALLNQVRNRESAGLTSVSLGDGRSGAEKLVASNDTEMAISLPDQAGDWKGADVPSPAAKVSEPATHFETPTEIINSIGMELKLIPGGEFLMGSPDSDRDAFGNEKPQHRVRITRPFYLGVYSVTRGQFQRFVEATDYRTQAEKDGEGGWRWDAAAQWWARDPKSTWRSPGFDQTDDHPVVNVSWNDASAFCDWLSRQESQEYRLPTEAEWEYACRAGTTTRFSFGDDENALGQFAWYSANSNRQTHPVGEKQPNGFGLHDMHGNVWEWCWDGYDADYYKQSPAIDPRGSEPAAHRVLRGGGWNFALQLARSASRGGNSPERSFNFLGFRLARGQSDRRAQ